MSVSPSTLWVPRIKPSSHQAETFCWPCFRTQTLILGSSIATAGLERNGRSIFKNQGVFILASVSQKAFVRTRVAVNILCISQNGF